MNAESVINCRVSIQVLIGFIVDGLCFLPTLFFVQLFRRIRPRRKPNQLSAVAQALIRLRGIKRTKDSKHAALRATAKKITTKKGALMLPWWWLVIAYIMSFLVVIITVFFTVARSIEFGDAKTQKWLVSIFVSFLSSVFFTQPIKVVCLTAFVVCIQRKSKEDDDNEAAMQPHEHEEIYLRDDEEYLHSMNNPMAAIRKSTPSNRLTQGQLAQARDARLRDKHMWQAVREMLGFIFLAFTIYTLSYLERDPNASFQVTHLRNLFLNVGKPNNDFTQVCSLVFPLQPSNSLSC